AVEGNPANHPPDIVYERIPLPREAQPRAELQVYHLALITSKYWGPQGVRLTVFFLDNPDEATRRRILEYANAWSTRANMQFRGPRDQNAADLRLARGPTGYWSYLGTDIKMVPRNQPNINLQSFTSRSPSDSEYSRVVPHEFGHASGFPHEHTRAEIVHR